MRELEHHLQTVLITGASSGIGAEFARRLAARGSGLVLVARRADRLESLAAELRAAHGVPVTALPFDLSGIAPGAALAAELDRRGIAVTAVINNAGHGSWGRFHDDDPAWLRHMIAVNVTAVADISRAFINRLRAHGRGYLLNVTSVAAYAPVPNQAAYSASKAFVLSLTESLWAESRGTGLRVLAFAPGVTSSEYFDVVGTADAAGGSRYRTPAQVVGAALRVLDRRDPPPSAVAGRLNHALTLAARLVTRRRGVALAAANTLR
ncbi:MULTISPECIES: SDR family NAD(P)-dependent oxidoreductase [Catenuloplanes]|uniref:Short-subunit dehydrogenase n=1 Tax=Catenuloplanes niger TaxID=587534 RepID=A0AAE3ZKZ3_9ACTN|nr:SDR family NAD(P)-dependent oxidoreductase [Catenuloplanes niger]MDR7320078.1 short-subunit dehydrogenase [Catenuloplanes niger]